MEYNKMIAKMVPGDQVEGFYVLKSAQNKNTVAGKPFLAAVLMDCSGTIEAKIWDYSGPIGPVHEGTGVKVRGSVADYRGLLQFTVDKIRLMEEDDQVDMSRLVPTAPINVEQTMDYVRRTVESMTDGDYRAICRWMLERYGDALRTMPAAKSVHHSFLSGLLMHTWYMLRQADFLAGLYKDLVDRDLLLAGTLLHDFAKAEEFTFSGLGLVTEYSVKGQLLGHLVMGAQQVAKAAEELGVPEEKSVLLQHMLLSHHGQPEFGAAVAPCCVESELLSMIDTVDSRMQIYREAMAEMEPGQFSKRIFALDKRIYRHD